MPAAIVRPTGLVDHVYNVLDYGAKGDGSTNDRAALQAAIDAADAASGGIVQFGPATYLIGSTLTVPAGVTLRGMARGLTTISIDDSMVGIRLDGDGASIGCMTLRRVSSFEGWAIEIKQGDHLRLFDLEIDGAHGSYLAKPLYHGINVAQAPVGVSTTGNDVRIEGCEFHDCCYGQFQDNSVTTDREGWVVSDCTFHDNYSDDLNFNSPNATWTNIGVVNCRFRDNHAPGTSGGFAVDFANNQNCTISGCTFDNYPFEAVHIEDRSRGIAVTGNSFVKCGHDSQERISVNIINDSRNITISGNTFDSTAITGTHACIFMGSGGQNPSYGVAVVGNTFLLGQGSTSVGSYLVSRVTFSANYVKGTGSVSGGSFSGHTADGIGYGVADYVTITGNMIEGCRVGIVGFMYDTGDTDPYMTMEIGGNVIFGCDYGIKVRNHVRPTIHDNTIVGCVTPIQPGDYTTDFHVTGAVIVGNRAMGCVNAMQFGGATTGGNLLDGVRIIRDNIDDTQTDGRSQYNVSGQALDGYTNSLRIGTSLRLWRNATSGHLYVKDGAPTGDTNGVDLTAGISVYNVKDYGATGNGSTDDTDALQAAFDAANTAGGGLVYVPAGKYNFTALDLDYMQGVSAIGCTTPQFSIPDPIATKMASLLICTSTGSSAAVSCRGVRGFKLSNLGIAWSSSSFSGYVLDFRYGASGGGAHIYLEDVIIDALHIADRLGPAALVCLDGMQDVSIRGGTYNGGKYGIIGKLRPNADFSVPDGPYGFAIGVAITDGAKFQGAQYASIHNVDSGWLVSGCVFEPISSTAPLGILNDSTYPGEALTVTGNWFGDSADGQTGAWITWNGVGLAVIGNMFSVGNSSSILAINANTALGICFQGNTAWGTKPGSTGIDFGATTGHAAFSVLGNRIDVSTLINGSIPAGSIVQDSSTTTPTTTFYSPTVSGTATVAALHVTGGSTTDGTFSTGDANVTGTLTSAEAVVGSPPVNILSAAQADFETGGPSCGWNDNLNSTIAQSTDQAAHGSNCLKLTATAANNCAIIATYSGLDAIPGAHYYMIAYIRAATTTRTVKVYFEHVAGSTWTPVGSTGFVSGETNSGWTKFTCDGVAPSGAGKLVPQIAIGQHTTDELAMNEVHYIDQVMLTTDPSGVWYPPGATPQLSVDSSGVVVGDLKVSGSSALKFAAAAPTSGTYIQGDIVFNTGAAGSGKVGWVCTTGGTPGTWKAFGAIDA